MTNQTVSTAVLLAAGRGSRRFPITKVIDKAMMPIGNRPVIDYVVEQCVEAGIKKLVFVVSTDDSLIKKYYGEAVVIEEEYPWLGKTGSVSCVYVTQVVDESHYGTGAAVEAVKDAVGDGAFITLAADGFIYGAKDSIIKEMINLYSDNDDISTVITGLMVTADDAKSYATIDYAGDEKLARLNEKPTDLEDGKSYPCNVSYYLFSQDIFARIEALEPVKGEYLITDAINALAIENKVGVIPVEGHYMDSGQLTAWVHANHMILQA